MLRLKLTNCIPVTISISENVVENSPTATATVTNGAQEQKEEPSEYGETIYIII